MTSKRRVSLSDADHISVCVSINVRRLITSSTTWTLKIVLKKYSSFSELILLNIICPWLACALMRMYSCMICPHRLYHCKLILICNSIWFTCHFVTNLALWTSPKPFLCQLLKPSCKRIWCCCDMKSCYFYFLKWQIRLQYQVSKHAPDILC